MPVRLIVKAKNTLSFLPWKQVLGEGNRGKKAQLSQAPWHTEERRRGSHGETGVMGTRLLVKGSPVLRVCSPQFSWFARCSNSYCLLGAYPSTDASTASWDWNIKQVGLQHSVKRFLICFFQRNYVTLKSF